MGQGNSAGGAGEGEEERDMGHGGRPALRRRSWERGRTWEIAQWAAVCGDTEPSHYLTVTFSSQDKSVCCEGDGDDNSRRHGATGDQDPLRLTGRESWKLQKHFTSEEQLRSSKIFKEAPPGDLDADLHLG